jgi:hypothetical protein
VKSVQEMEDVISYYYQGGSNHRTEFWKAASSRAARAPRKTRGVFALPFARSASSKQRGSLHAGPSYAFSPHTWQIVDAALGYRSLDGARDSR